MAKRYDLLTVREDQDNKGWWTKIGAAWETKDGSGYNLIFEALPLPGKDGQCRVVMKVPTERRDDR